MISDEARAKLWSLMDACKMIAIGSICLTIAISLPFVAFGWLHRLFCN